MAQDGAWVKLPHRGLTAAWCLSGASSVLAAGDVDMLAVRNEASHSPQTYRVDGGICFMRGSLFGLIKFLFPKSILTS